MNFDGLNSRLSKLPVFRSLDSHMAEIVRGASIAFILKIIGAALAFAFNIVLARLLGAEGTGIYFLAFTVCIIASVFGRMGLDNVILRFIASNAATKDWDAVKGVYNKGMIMAISASTVSAALVFILAPTISTGLFKEPELIVPLRWMSLSIVFFSLYMLHSQSLKGLKKISAAIFLPSISVPLFSLCTIWLLAEYFGVTGAACSYAFATAVTLVIGICLWQKHTPNLKSYKADFDTKVLVRTGMPLFWVSSMNVLMNLASAFLLGIWRSSAEVGVYSIAQRTALLTSLVLIAVNSIAAPKFAALYKQNDFQALESTAKNSTKIMAIMASPFLIVFAVAPGWVMSFFGSEFSYGALALTILALGQFVNVTTGSVGYLLMMCGYEKLMRNTIFITAITNIALNIILIKHFGFIGASVATAFCLSMQNLIAVFLVWKKLKIWTIPLPPINRFCANKCFKVTVNQHK